MEVYLTTYDGYYVTTNGRGKIQCYEGKALCPPRIQKLIESGEVKKLDCFHDEAVKFGYVK